MRTTHNTKCPHCSSPKIYYRRDATVWECENCSAWFNVKLELTHLNWDWYYCQYSLNKIEQHLTRTQFYRRVFNVKKDAGLYYCVDGCGKLFPLELVTEDRCPFCVSSRHAPYRE